MAKQADERFSEEETARRRDVLAKRMLSMPPHPLKPKSTGATKASPLKKRGRPAND